jgi:lipoyl-dependent peroxiredoxin
MKRTARVQWQGPLKRGKGTLTTESGALLNVPYNFLQRFENAKGTNPEELLGAAHAACFSMFMSAELEKRGLIPESIDVTAEVSLDHSGPNWKITQSHLRVVARVPGATAKQVDEVASYSKDNCIVSKALNTHISMELHVPNIESVAPKSMI